MDLNIFILCDVFYVELKQLMLSSVLIADMFNSFVLAPGRHENGIEKRKQKSNYSVK